MDNQYMSQFEAYVQDEEHGMTYKEKIELQIIKENASIPDQISTVGSVVELPS